MAKVKPETLTPEHVKAARAFLKWSAADLARSCNVGVATVRLMESGGKVRESSRAAIMEALEYQGIEFSNGGSPGVKLKSGGLGVLYLEHSECEKAPKWNDFPRFQIRAMAEKGGIGGEVSHENAEYWIIEGVHKTNGTQDLHITHSLLEAEKMKARYEKASRL